MRKVAILSTTLLLAMPAFAQQGGHFRATLTGFEEVPPVFTTGQGRFEARLSQSGTSIDYTLTYSDLQADATQAHIHFGQMGVNGGVVAWLCAGAGTTAPAGTPTCPARAGTVTGTILDANVLAAAAQQFPAGDLDALVTAMIAGATYANVHTTASPGGEIRGQINPRGNHGRFR